MIPSPHRHKGGASQLGAAVAGQSGPFGVRPAEDAEPEPDDDLDVDGGLGDEPEPEPEPTSHVEQQVAARIAAAKVRIAAARERRESFAEARRHGLVRRHAQRIRNLRDAEERRLEAERQAD